MLDDAVKLLAVHGLLPTSSSAVQIDITTVLRSTNNGIIETYLCDHNCTTSHQGKATGGHYECPASFTLNRGAVASSAAPGDRLIEGIENVIAAARSVNEDFVETGFDGYAGTFRLPRTVSSALRASLVSGNPEITLFGGSPERHPDILPIVRGLRERDYSVHITMTGRRIMRSPEFYSELASTGVNVVAVSLDDIPATDQLHAVLECNTEELRMAWRNIHPLHGQRQKVYEALHLARIWKESTPTRRPNLLFNIAVHPGNAGSLRDFMPLLAAEFPGAWLNPFPAQIAAVASGEKFDAQNIHDLRDFVSQALRQQLGQRSGQPGDWAMVPRLHYWLLLSALMDEPLAAVKAAGLDTWQCFRSPAAARYVQVSGTGGLAQASTAAGGKVGCFWNTALNDHGLPAVWDASPQQLRSYLHRRPALAATARPGCPGCLFPRLVGDMVSLECGMDPMLRRPYLALREKHLGF